MLCEKINKEELGNLGTNWKCNFKFDGERIMAIVKDGEVQLINRRGNLKNNNYLEVVEELKKLPDCILDGEVISEDDDFNKLQQRALTKDSFKQSVLRKQVPVKYMVFDIVELAGKNLVNEPLKMRVGILQSILIGNLQYLETAEVMEISVGYVIASEMDKEGIVVKDMNSKYENRRSQSWKKCKFWEEGYMKAISYEENPKGIRVEDDKKNAVQCAGSEGKKVKELIDSQGYCELEIQYLELTEDGRMRFPSFRKIMGGVK
jgi:ATP-dependent DNA ligase